ncbi:MAG: tetratricopeptide repeat protein [Bacteroidia bacterium]|nr:tetratricopeptide repeat protein [Bacteroidia bacterium]
MSTNKNIQDPEIKVGEALSKTEQFLEKYKNVMIYAVVAILVVAGAIYAYRNLVALPAQQEAMGQTFTAEQYFRNGDFEKALNGDGNALGFAEIISEYGTKSGEAVYFYAGVCNLQLGKFQEAIDYLKKYNGEDEIILARAIACIGDAYAGLNDFDTAISYYKKAASSADNIFAANYLMKAGIMYQEQGNTAEALKMYQEIKDKYPQSNEGYEIDKYITRIQPTK